MLQNISGHILRIPKTKTPYGYRYCYSAIVPVGTAKELYLSGKEGLLLKTTKGIIFPTVVIIKQRKDRKNSYIYSFTVPKNLVNGYNKNINFEIISRVNVGKLSFRPKDSPMINLKEVLPPKTVKDHNIYKFDLDNNKLLIWIYSRSHTNYFILPCFVPLEIDNFSFLELMGFLFSEGYKYRKSGGFSLDTLSFSNEDEEQIKWSLQAFERLFDIKVSKWKARIHHPEPKKNEEKIKTFWSKLGINHDNIKVYQNKNVNSEFGACEPYINSIVLAEIINELLNYAKLLSLIKQKNAVCFFRGLSRGDIGVTTKNRITIDLSQKEKNDVLFFCKLCKRLKLKTGKPYFDKRKKYWSVKITNYKDFRKIIKIGGITHSKRKRNLLKAYLSALQSTPFKYLRAVANGMNTSDKAANFLDISPVTTGWYFRKLKNNGFLKGNGYSKYNPLVYRLTKRGREELNFYERIKKEVEGVENE